MWGDMSLWNVQGTLLHSVQFILTVDYTFKRVGRYNHVGAFIHHLKIIPYVGCQLINQMATVFQLLPINFARHDYNKNKIVGNCVQKVQG